MGNIKDIIIIGSGPAGLSAAIYAKRAMMDIAVLEKKGFSGGQIVDTEMVDNYLGMYNVNGFEMAMKFREHADKFEVPFITAEVASINDLNDKKELILADGSKMYAKSVIIATGATHKKLQVTGETQLTGKGVSYCATCDGAFFRNKTVAVIGGGNIALEDALYLSKLCEKVYLVHRRDIFRASKDIVKLVNEKENIEFLPFYEVSCINGNEKVENIELVNNQTGETKVLAVSGVFVGIGMEPRTELVQGLVDIDETGYIKALEDTRTSVSGIYAIGDVRTKELRQIVTAVSDGAVCINSIEKDMGSR